MRHVLAGLLLISLSCIVHAQNGMAGLMHQAAHCLAVKNFLPASKTKRMTFGYFLDENSYPGEKVLYVINYSAPSHPDGFVFAVFLTEHNGHIGFNIQNNAQFKLSKSGDEGVSFISPPLGGTWTQQRLIAAIKKMEKQPRLTIPVENLPMTDSSISCESYADPEGK